MALEELLADPRIWRAAEHHVERSGRSTGHPALDALLPQSGWPADTLVELLPRLPGRPAGNTLPRGIGVLSLLLPTLRACTAAGQRVALIEPPGMLHAPALQAAGVATDKVLVVDSRHAASARKPGPGNRPGNGPGDAPGDALWACEQILASAACALVCMWHRSPLSVSRLRRLKLACARGHSLGILVRPAVAQTAASPAALRLGLKPVSSRLGDQRLEVALLRAEGSWRQGRCEITLWAGPASAQTLRGE